MRRRRVAAVALVASFAVAVWTGCLGATEITLQITTDVPCSSLAGTEVVVGRLAELETKPPTTSSTACDPSGNLGALVVVPSGGARDEVAVRVVAGVGRDPASCAGGGFGPGCIVARRALHYIPHENLRVAVPLRASCNGVVCGPSDTCVMGACTSATIADPSACASGDGCGEGSLAPADGGAPPPPPADAGADAGADAPPDAPPPPAPRPATCGDVSGLQTGAPWPMRAFCPTHQGRTTRIGPQTPAIAWQATVAQGDVGGIPTIGADGTVYIGSNARTLTALLPDGGARWTLPVGGNINNPAAAIAADGTLTVPCSDSYVYHVRSDGGVAWRFFTNSDMVSSPAIADDGTILVGGGYFNATSQEGKSLLTLSPADGGVLREFTTSKGVAASPAIGVDGTVYFIGTDGILYALDEIGKLRWSLPVGASNPSGPVIADDGTIYAQTGTGLAAVTPAGASAWQIALSSPTDPAIGEDGTLYLTGADAGDAGAAIVYLRALSPVNGAERWRAPVGPRVAYSPVVGGDGTIYVAGYDAEVHAFAPNGTERWTVTLGGAVNSGLALGDHVLYVGTTVGTFYAIGP